MSYGVKIVNCVKLNLTLPSPYKIEFVKYVKDPREKERTLHKLLQKYTERVHTHREFFRISPDDLRVFFDLIDGSY